MAKIICDLCGTSYSDTAELCPICGSARPVEAESVSEDENIVQNQYHHVSGGRFSKANVKKRNQENSSDSTEKKLSNKETNEEKTPSNKPLVLTIIILLVAIFAVLAYDVVALFVPDLLSKDSPVANTPTYDLSRPTEGEKLCTEITLEENTIVIEKIGDTYTLTPVITPADTTDECLFDSDDKSVATVSAEGVITAVGSGETVITISCGDVSVSVGVSVTASPDVFELDYKEITLSYAEEGALLYTGSIPAEEILWASDDESVAVIYMGYVYAVAEGETTVYAGYDGKIASCVVRCEFADGEGNTGEETGGEDTQTEATEPVDDNGPYKIKNKYGFSDSDATISVGESFNLILVDKNGDTVTGVEWSVVDGDCCTVTDGTVTGVTSGQAKVVATYNGKTYSFLVRVG